jgi:hypothetical protein
MPLLVRSGSKSKMLSPKKFAREEELQLLLKDCPDLLRDGTWTGDQEDEDQAIAFVAREVPLREAGRLDLLFVDRSGMPICVEVKLGCNDEVRRTVVAQAIDYLSALTCFTVDELDEAVNGQLKNALLGFAPAGDDEFARLWRVVGTNLRERKAELVVVVDDAPPSLERIFHFLAESSDLDVRLFTVQHYESDAGEIFVSQSRVDPRAEPGSRRSPGARPAPGPELDAAFEAYNADPFEGVRAEGAAPFYRMIRPEPLKKRCTYEFVRKANSISIKMIVRDDVLKETAKAFVDGTLAEGQGTLKWYESQVPGQSYLAAEFPLDTLPVTVAGAMRDLMSMTKDQIMERIQLLSATKNASPDDWA